MIKIRGALSQVYSQDGCTELRGFRRYSGQCNGHAMESGMAVFLCMAMAGIWLVQIPQGKPEPCITKLNME